MKKQFLLLVLFFVLFFITGCGMTHDELLNEQIETIKKCREAGVGVYQTEFGHYYCDEK